MLTLDRVIARFKQAGGSDFQTFVRNPDVRAAFREAVDDAIHEHGHGGYSGTIKEKSGYTIRQNTPLTQDAAHDFIRKDIEQNNKWGPAFAIPIGEAASAKEKKAKVRVGARDEWAAREEASKLLKEKFGEPGFSVSMKIDKVTLVKEGKLPEMKIEKGGTEGFKVSSDTASFYAGRGPYVFASRAEAISAIKAAIPRDKPEPGRKYVVEKFKTTDTFVIGDTTKSMHLYEVEAALTFSKPTGKILGWMFYGIASS